MELECRCLLHPSRHSTWSCTCRNTCSSW